MIDKLWSVKDLEGNGRSLIEVLSQHLPEETEANHKNTSVIVVCVEIKIRTEYFPILVRHHYTKMFGLSHVVA
jgi:hypothetical protein